MQGEVGSQQQQQHSVDLIARGNHCIDPGHSRVMTFSVGDDISGASSNNTHIIHDIPASIKMIHSSVGSSKIKTRIANKTTVPIFLMHNDILAIIILHYIQLTAHWMYNYQ